MEEFIDALRNMEGYRNQIEHIHVIQAQKEEYGTLDHPLPEAIQGYLDDRGIKLYRHQADLINLARSGENVVISTPTASGKTLAFNIPVFEALLEDREARALYIYPMKALTNDQLKVLLEMEGGTGIQARPSIYDGDTPTSSRPRIREESRIILTNPYGLHYYLPWYRKWRNFFQNLRYIIIDESHTYRGVFGSNVAMLLRRLQRIINKYGSHPQFILSSATIANPEEHSERLTGKGFRVVDGDYSESGRKYFTFWNPPLIGEENQRGSTHQESKEVFIQCLLEGLQTLCFTVSRKMAELTALWARQELHEDYPGIARAIRSYRAGYLPRERREIEKGLKTGELRGVTSTNALELGIDVGSLDSVIISGYPGTIISTWQQAGRAGRGVEDSIIFLVAFQNPLDQYFMNHPQDFFQRTPENAVIDLDNPYITTGHVMCAANEAPITDSDGELFSNLDLVIKALEETGALRPTPLGHVYARRSRPVETVKLNSISDDMVQILHNGRILETMDLTQAYREAHEGAILLHQGETYQVYELDLNDLTAKVRHTEVDHYTEAVKTIEISIIEGLEERSMGFKAVVGELDITEYYTHYRLMNYERVLDLKPLDLPPVEFPSIGLWFTIPEEIVEQVQDEGLDFMGGIHAIEHAMIAMAPLHAMCDRWDLGGLSADYHPDTGEPTIFIYDGYKGGIGLSEKLYHLLPELMETTLKLVKDCRCNEGCPSCIYSPKCGNNNEPLDKKGAIQILTKLLEQLQGEKDIPD
jgi:DEAD/DEAH box helicase domain-containing protein